MIEVLEFIFDDIEECECIGEFEDEYVYDIEMNDDTHTFIANDILVHNSLYISYDGILSTIKGLENMNQRQKLDVIVGINEKFLNNYNKNYISDYYKSRHVESIHDFELETVALSGLWLDVKKRYCQILLWKDGKYFDEDSLPMKVKGLEMTKSSYPKFVRTNLKKAVRSILESPETDMNLLWDYTNILVQKMRREHLNAPLEDICANQGINGYNKYISNDPQEHGIQSMVVDKQGDVIYFRSKSPASVKALAAYNTIRENHNLPGDPIYGGKCKLYFAKSLGRKYDTIPFAFQAKNYPKWGGEYAPCDRGEMFSKYFLDPLNRICGESMNFKPFKLDGSKTMTLFDFGL